MSHNIYFLPRKRKCSHRQQTLSSHRFNVSLRHRHIPCCKTLKSSSFKQTQMLPSVKLIFTIRLNFSLSLSSVWAVQVSIDWGTPTPLIKLSATVCPTTAQRPKCLGVMGFWIGPYGLFLCEILMIHLSGNVNKNALSHSPYICFSMRTI